MARKQAGVTGAGPRRWRGRSRLLPDDGEAAAVRADASRALAIRWVATLHDRPFRPSVEQLARVDGGDLVAGEAHDRRAAVAAGRYAGLFADHVAQDIEAEAGPGAYALVWACARLAFIESLVPQRHALVMRAGEPSVRAF